MRYHKPTMTNVQRFSLLRLAGLIFFYAGVTKLLNLAWSAGYLTKAKTFSGIVRVVRESRYFTMDECGE